MKGRGGWSGGPGSAGAGRAGSGEAGGPGLGGCVSAAGRARACSTRLGLGAPGHFANPTSKPACASRPGLLPGPAHPPGAESARRPPVRSGSRGARREGRARCTRARGLLFIPHVIPSPEESGQRLDCTVGESAKVLLEQTYF